MKKTRAQRRKAARNARLTKTQRVDTGAAAAILLTGTLALPYVQVHAAGLPVPCSGTSTCANQPFDPLKVQSTLASGTSQLVWGNNNLTINQGSAPTAIFNWASFNISPGSTVTFNQASTSSVALNRIFDSNVTSISGNLFANGQIYLVNPNGILFGHTANVNVGGLIASTLDIADQRITNGLFSLSATEPTAPVFSSDASYTGSLLSASANANPAITVQSGATLYAAGRNQSGSVVSAGRIFLFAPTVEDGGKITVDGGGQVILAAGSNVYLGSSSDPALRGLLVEVNGGNTSAVTIDPGGSITVARGNITLMGLAVNVGQNASLTATSALDANGSIYLLAREADNTEPLTGNPGGLLFAAAATGTVDIGTGAQIRVVLDPTDTATAPSGDPTAASLRSTIDIEGASVAIGGKGNPNSTVIQANGGDITVTARTPSSTNAMDYTYSMGDGSSVLGIQNPSSTISIGSDVLIDASGLQNVQANGAEYFAYIDRLTSSNLANAPYQRTGFLLGQSLYLNLLDAPSWLNVSNLLNAVPETQAQRNATAGSVNLFAEGSIDLAKGSTINVSGGSIDYSAAIGRTSTLIAANGSVVNIANASPDVQYVGFADHGSTTLSDSVEGISVTSSWTVPNYSLVGGFAAGTNAGTVNIYAPQVQLNGNLLASSIASTQQRSNPTADPSLYAAQFATGLPLSQPLGGLLEINGINIDGLDSEAGFSRPSIVLTDDPSTAAPLLNGEQSGTPIVLNMPALLADGFSRFTLTSDGIVEVAPNSPLNFGALGQLTVNANATVIASSITAAGGSVTVAERPLTSLGADNAITDEISQRNNLNLVTDASLRGSVTAAPGVSLNVAGNWINDEYPTQAQSPTNPIVLNGGTISLSGRSVNVSGVDMGVSAGAYLSPDGVFSGGSGGTISLTGTYKNGTTTANGDTADQGQLILGSDFSSRIQGYGVTAGGTLSLYAPSLVIDSTGTSNTGSLTMVDSSVVQQGFQTFKFSSFDSLVVAPGTVLAPDIRLIPNSVALDITASSPNLPSAAQPLPALPGQAFASSFSLKATNAYDGTITLGPQSMVDAGTGSSGSIAISAGNAVQIDGTLIAQGGNINATLGAPPASTYLTPSLLNGRGIVLNPGSVIDVNGASLVVANASGVRSGNVLNAGSVTLNATNGTVATEPGSLIEAEGTSDAVDILVAGSQYQRQTVASSGGTVDVSANNGVLIEGAIQAGGGSASAGGASLSLVLFASPNLLNGNQLPADVATQISAPSVMTVTSSLPTLSAGQTDFTATANRSVVSAATLSSSGFSRIWLQSADNITFAGGTPTLPISVTAPASLVLAAQSIGVAPGSGVKIQSPYVAIGPAQQLSSETFLSPLSANALPAATTGSGSLLVQSGSLDLIGNFSLQGIGQATLLATGDVRAIGVPTTASAGPTAAGSLSFGGNLTIDAARVYPTTQTIYTISGPTSGSGIGTLTIGSSATAASTPVLSAGGSLTIDVANLYIQGAVQAPLGNLSLNASNSLTLAPGSLVSVAGTGLVPYGTVLNGTTWTYGIPVGDTIDPVSNYAIASSNGITIPSKSITLQAGTLAAKPGSTINISGGGDVLGMGFVAGPGGSYDWSQNFVNAARNPFFALVPSQGTATAAYDSQIYSNLVLNTGLPTQSGSFFQIGQTITIASGSSLPAGTYTILPPAYALLPGAYAVEAAAGYQNLQPGNFIAMPDGSAIVPGRLGEAAAGILASEWSGFRVYTSAQFQTFSQFQLYQGSSFLSALANALDQVAPRVGPDAGQLQVAANSVQLTSSIESQADSSGRGADIEIDVPEVVVADNVAASATPSSTLTLSATQLTALGAETLVLGGLATRSDNGGASGSPGTTLAVINPVVSSSVSIQSTKTLSAGEIVLSSANVQLADGAQLLATGGDAAGTTQIVANGDGALLYLGSVSQAPSYARVNASAPGATAQGQLNIGAAHLAGGSLIADASVGQSYDPGASFSVNAVNVSASVLNLGNVPTGTLGVDLSAQILAEFGSAKYLTLTALGGIDVYGSTTLGPTNSSGQPLLAGITLVGPGIAGFGASTDVVNLNAGQITLTNPAGAAMTNTGSGTGSLNIAAQAGGPASGNIGLGGAIGLSGFSTVNFSATGVQASGTTTAGTGDFVFTGNSGTATNLQIAGNGSALNISASRVTAQSGVNASVNLSGDLAISASGPAPSSYDLYDLGATLTVTAADINVTGRLDFPSGVVKLASAGPNGITLGTGAYLRVAGVTQTFASTTADSAAGSIALTATNGSVTEAAGATLDLSGSGQSGDAGSLSISSPNGVITLQGALNLTPGANGLAASVCLDASNLANADALVNAIASAAGGSVLNSVSLRARSGDITLSGANGNTPASTIRAGNIVLEADGTGGATDGSINMNGVLDASGVSGGQIALYANDQITLGGTIDVHASGSGQAGGTALLSARVNANPSAPTTLDAVLIQSGANINLSGGPTGTDGTLILRSVVNASGSDVDIAAIPLGAITSTNNALANNNQPAPNIVVQAVTVNSSSGPLTLDQTFWSNESAALTTFMSATNVTNITTRLLGSSTADANFHLQPGLQIESAGSITVANPVDFSTGLTNVNTGSGTFTWRYGGSTLATSQPGELTLIAGGDLNIQANISDGVATTTDSAGNPFVKAWSGGTSWSYVLTAGGDLSASNPNQTIAGAGSLYIGTAAEPGVAVRTGTGSINLNAGENVVLNNGPGQQDNVVYTAGVASVSLPHFATLPMDDVYGEYTTTYKPVITQSGGNLTVVAQNDIFGTDTAGDNQDGSWQAVNQWLFRTGYGTSTSPAAWWSDLNSFQQGFGALGGGNLNLTAGGDIIRVGAVVPTSGYVLNGSVFSYNSGSLNVTAGGSIVQGFYYDEAGTATLRAASLESNGAATSFVQNVALAQGDNTFSIITREGAEFAIPFNPTVNSASANLTAVTGSNVFFTFGPGTSFNVQSASGSIVAFNPQLNSSSTSGDSSSITLLSSNAAANLLFAPTNVYLTAFGGNITAGGNNNGFWTTGIEQYPDAKGQLSLLANGSISQFGWYMSQADASTLPTASAPIPDATIFDLTTPLASSTTLHANDASNAEIVTRNGDLSNSSFNLPKTTEISVGGDIGPQVVLDIQNSNANSLTSISAAGQINLTSGTPYDSILIAGQGTAQIISGGAMNLGTDGDGILSLGNEQNTRLPALGASLIVAAGTGTTSLANAVVAALPNYLNLIDNYVRYDAFAAAGNGSATLNQQVIATLSADASMSALVQALNAGLAARSSVNDPSSEFNQLVGQLTPGQLALGALKLAAAIQTVANAQFINSANTDTFAPAYAAFDDLFPNLAASANVIKYFVQNNPFVAAGSSANGMLASVLQDLPTALASVIELGLSDPSSVNNPASPFSQALSAIDATALQSDARALLASVLTVAGQSRNTLAANGQLTSNGSPYATALTRLANAFTPQTTNGLNDLQMEHSEIETEQTGSLAILVPQGSINVGQANAPVLDTYAAEKTASQLGIYTLGGGDIIGLVRNDFNVYQSRVFTVAGGNITLWSSQGNVDAGNGPRDVTVSSPPVLETDPNTGIEYLNLGAVVSGSGIGALETSPDQPPSNINLMAPAGYIDAGEAGIRAQTGKVLLGTNLVLNASNIQAASGISGGAVVAAPPPPPPPSTGLSASDKVVEDAQREALAEQLAGEQRAAGQMQMRVRGEFLGFERECAPDDKECISAKEQPQN